MMALLAFALACAGFAALALAMNRHHRQVWQRPAPGRRGVLLRVAGAAALGASFAACVAHSGWAVGAVLWLGLSSVTAPAVALVLTYRPQLFALAATGSGPPEPTHRERT